MMSVYFEDGLSKWERMASQARKEVEFVEIEVKNWKGLLSGLCEWELI